jgi:hypothetical protein
MSQFCARPFPGHLENTSRPEGRSTEWMHDCMEVCVEKAYVNVLWWTRADVLLKVAALRAKFLSVKACCPASW